MLKLSSELVNVALRASSANFALRSSSSAIKKRQPINRLLNKKKDQYKQVSIYSGMTIAQLAEEMEKSHDHVLECISTIGNVGLFRNRPNQEIHDIFLLQEIVRRSGMKPVHISKPKEEAEEIAEIIDLAKRPPPDSNLLKKRPPVIAILGHVDHGKTTLLDALRKSTIALNEPGGITQHIGAFRVSLPNSESITVLDTPGHAAFRSLRARGAKATDVSVLIVAGDDGVMQQTKESIELLREADCPIVVAITMTDRPNYNLTRVKRQLLEVGLAPEDMGGETQVVPICAPKGQGLKELTEAIIAEAELIGISGDPTGPVEGFVLESTVAVNRGAMKAATVLVERGTLRKGDVLVSGTALCRVKLMLDDREKPVEKVGPGEAAVVFGWKEMPPAAELVFQADNEPHAGKVIACRRKKETEEKAALDALSAEEKLRLHQEQYRKERKERLEKGFFRKIPTVVERKPEERVETAGGRPRLSLVVKADTDGSIEALLGVLATYRSKKCDLSIVHYGIGPIAPSDVEMATPFKALIVSFNAQISPQMKELIENRSLKVIQHNIIYRLLDSIRDELTSKLPLKQLEEKIGEATVLQTFKVTESKKKTAVAGSRVTSGQLTRNDMYRVTRKSEIVFDGQLSSLRHFKADVPTITSGQECGLRFGDEFMPEAGDVVLCYRKLTVPDKIDWEP